MLYHVYTTHTHTDADGNEQQTTKHITLDAHSAAAVHALFAAERASGAQVKVYADTATPDGLMLAAFSVAHKSAKKSTERGGNDTQWRIRNALDGIAHGLHLTAGLVAPGEYIADKLPDAHADAQEFVQCAAVGIMYGHSHNGRAIDGMEQGADVPEQYHAGYAAVNRYISAQRAATERELSTEYIVDGGGDIVAINAAIACIIRGGEKWIPSEGGGMDAETAARLGAAITAACKGLSKVQQDTARMIAAGYSMRQAAAKLRRNVRTIEAHAANIRAKIAAYIRDNAPEFAHLIDSAAVNAAAARQGERRTAEGAAREKSNAAERMRRYRERKAAERKAAQGE